MSTLRAQYALRKVAFNWAKLGERAAYGAGGAGVGLATNALLGNKSLASYLTGGALGLGGGLLTQALVDYWRLKNGVLKDDKGDPKLSPIPNVDPSEKPKLTPIPGVDPSKKPEIVPA